MLVKGWAKGASWTFPKGKINQDEPERDCALRELREETGFDATHLLPADSKDYLELTMREQKVRLYIVPGVSESTPMVTQTRREISVRVLTHTAHRMVVAFRFADGQKGPKAQPRSRWQVLPHHAVCDALAAVDPGK